MVDAAYHITSNATNTVVGHSVRLAALVVAVSGAGTAWIISVQNKEGTPKYVYRATAAVGTVTLNVPHGILMTTGIDIVTSGTTAGTVDVFIVYHDHA